MFIQFNGYNNQPIYIRTSRILAVNKHLESTPESPLSVITVTLGEVTDEWAIRESVESVISKLYDPT